MAGHGIVSDADLDFANVGDTLKNLVTKMGTSGDKATYSSFFHRPLDRAELTAAFRGDWLARKGVTIPAEDATREWRTWSGDPGMVRAIEGHGTPTRRAEESA